MILIEKDLHFRSDGLFGKAYQRYFDWLRNNFGSDFIYISLGDWFHSPKPSPNDYSAAIKEFEKRKFRQTIILAGNHDYNRQDNSYSCDPLAANSRFKIQYLKTKTEMELEGLKFLFLPYVYNDIKKYAELSAVYDYILYHFEDETITYDGRTYGINLQNLNGKRVGGHVHKIIWPNYFLGMPVHTRADEAGQPNQLLVIDEKKELNVVPVPNFLDYYFVTYPEKVEMRSEYGFIVVKNVPLSVEDAEVRQMYDSENTQVKDIVFELFSKKQAEEYDVSASESIQANTIEMYMREFFSNANYPQKLYDQFMSFWGGST